MYRLILVPLDGSSFGEQAVPLAQYIAHHAGAQLRLVHVHDPVSVTTVEGMAFIDRELNERQRAQAQSYLDGLRQRLADTSQVPVTRVLLDGTVVQALVDDITTMHADLVVMTTHGRGGLARAWLGSVADHLVRQSHVPVLLIRPAHTPAAMESAPQVRRIMIPLDGSARAEAVLEPALALGEPMQARYVLIRVAAPAIVGAYIPGVMEPAVLEALTQQHHLEATTYLQSVAQRLQAKGVQVHTQVLTSAHPARAILDAATAHACDVIALATHGLGGVTRLLLGSVADKVVRGAEQPVLLYRPRETVAARS